MSEGQLFDTELILTTYMLDVVQPFEREDEEPQVQLVTYKVLGKDPGDALDRFFNHEAGVVMYEGDIVDRILVGVEQAAAPIDVS